MTSSDSGDDADDGLKSLRAVWLAMPDEDPPERGLADLMAAARVKVEQMTAPTLWERFAQQLRRPQVLAFASVMVLMGGALLISQRGDDVAVQAPASRDDLTAGAQAAPSAATESNTSPAVTVQTGEAKAEEADAVPMSPPPEPAPQAVVERPAPNLAKQQTQSTAIKGKLDRDHAFGAAGGGPRGGEGTTSLLAADADEPVEKTTTKQVATAPVEAGPSMDATAAAGSQARPTVTQLHTKARAAATRGDCEAVRTTTQRIAKQDARYYKAKVAQDPALAACLRR